MGAKFSTTAYRYPYETLILISTILVVLGVIAFTAAATVCTSAIFIPAVVIVGYYAGRSRHRELIEHAMRVTETSMAELLPVIDESASRLQTEPIDVFIAPSNQLNAYTFGMDSPKAVVLYSSLFRIMDWDEVQFIIGHELGHVKLGHTKLNTLMGGMAGIPSSSGAGVIMELAFQWWNRACEYSADRAGVLACAKPDKAISALVKLEARPGRMLSQEGMQSAIQQIETQDEDLSQNIIELLASHPMAAKRIAQIRKFSNSQEYRTLQTLMDKNLT
jgi:Zn-dependent protease with chaperone function